MWICRNIECTMIPQENIAVTTQVISKDVTEVESDDSWDTSSVDSDVIREAPRRGTSLVVSPIDAQNNNKNIGSHHDQRESTTKVPSDEFLDLEDDILEKYLTDESDAVESLPADPELEPDTGDTQKDRYLTDESDAEESIPDDGEQENTHNDIVPQTSSTIYTDSQGPVTLDIEDQIVEKYISDEEDSVISNNCDVRPKQFTSKNRTKASDSTDSGHHASSEEDSDDLELENDIIADVFGEEVLAELNKPYQARSSEDDDPVKIFLQSPSSLTGESITITPGCNTPPLAALTMNLSFAGCGFLGIYHLGVAHSLIHHGRSLLMNVHKFGGASAGSLVASALAIRGPDKRVVDECIDFCFNLADTVRKKKLGVLTPGVSLLDPLQELLDNLMPDDAHKIANNRLYVSITCARTKKNRIVSEFESKPELIQYLLGSSYVPRITGKKPVRLGNQKLMDGGMTDNLPELPDGRTILVTPFSGRQHICPMDKSGKGKFVRINGQDFQMTPSNLRRGLHAFFPPKRKQLERYLQKGKDDCIRFLKKENFYEEDAYRLADNRESIAGKSPLMARDPLRPMSFQAFPEDIDLSLGEDTVDLDHEDDTNNFTGQSHEH